MALPFQTFWLQYISLSLMGWFHVYVLDIESLLARLLCHQCNKTNQTKFVNSDLISRAMNSRALSGGPQEGRGRNTGAHVADLWAHLKQPVGMVPGISRGDEAGFGEREIGEGNRGVASTRTFQTLWVYGRQGLRWNFHQNMSGCFLQAWDAVGREGESVGSHSALTFTLTPSALISLLPS